MEIELEDSLIPDIPLRTTNVPKRTSSVFDFAFILSPDDSKDAKYTEYEQKLQNEVSQWHNLMTKIKNASKNDNQNKMVTADILTTESKYYLNNRPDIRAFVDESIDFRIKALKYLCHHNELLDIHQSLLDTCNDRLADISDTIALTHLTN